MYGRMDDACSGSHLIVYSDACFYDSSVYWRSVCCIIHTKSRNRIIVVRFIVLRHIYGKNATDHRLQEFYPYAVRPLCQEWLERDASTSMQFYNACLRLGMLLRYSLRRKFWLYAPDDGLAHSVAENAL